MSFTTKIPSETRIQKARTTLLLDHPFFGTLLFRLGGKASRSVATMATDGVSLFYNPEFVETLNAAELAGVLAHEVMHPALQHHTRRGDRDPTRWNMACDYAINPMLLDAGLTLPKDVLLDHRFRGMSAERIYNLIEEDEKQEGSSCPSESQVGNGSGGSEDSSLQNDPCGDEPSAPSTPGGVGQVLDAPAPEEGDGPSIAEQAREWQIAVEQAETVAKVAGKLPGGAIRAKEASQAARVNWRELLRRAWSDTIPSDYRWIRPNRRHVWAGLYLPGICQGRSKRRPLGRSKREPVEGCVRVFRGSRGAGA
jgi:predicted metal-dependent peptidase